MAIAAAVSAGVSAEAVPTVTVGVIWKTTSERAWLARLREWCNKPARALSLPSGLRSKVTIEQLESPTAALEWRTQMPTSRILVCLGFRRNDFAQLQPFSTANAEPLLLSSGAPAEAKEHPSADFFDHRSIVVSDDIVSQVRKSVLRMTLRQKVVILSPTSLEGLAEYFSLRYSVWSAAGFLKDANKQSRLKWEIDYADRTAIPLVAISFSGHTIASVRLVRSYGREEEYYVSRVQELLMRASDQVLIDQFNFPHSVVHPFDVLEEFRGFRATFRSLIQNKIEMAEIGRVAVDKMQRGQGLAEVLVDTAIALSKRKCISRLFLACPETVGPLLYGRCGFKAVPGLRSSKFLNIALPSIVMERSN